MSLPDPPLSRRAVMQAAGIAPVILLARKAWAQPTEENLMRLAAATQDVPDKQLRNVVDKAHEDHSVDKDKFELVARAMWAHFRLGAAMVEVSEEQKIMEHAYEFKSGPIVATRVKDGFFDPLGNHYVTNFCCYVCGHHAAMIAIEGIEESVCGEKIAAETPPKITKKIYECAWKLTEKEMKQKVETARSLGEGGDALADKYQGGGC